MWRLNNTVLAEIGWDVRLPPPPINAENKLLMDQLFKKEADLLQLENKHESYNDEREYVTEYSKNVHQELKNIEALRKLNEREEEVENHLSALAERETGHLAQEIAKLDNNHRSSAERQNVLEKHIFKANQKLEEFKNQLNWDQQTTDAFLEEAALKEEDTMAIIKYAQQDEQRIKSLTLAIEKKTLEVNKTRKALDAEFTETMSTQIALDKTAESLQQAHLQTQHFIHQLECTFKQMNQRDTEMQQYALQIAKSNKNIRESDAILTEKKHLYETVKIENRETEMNTTLAKRQAFKLRLDLKEKDNDCRKLQEEFDSYKVLRDRTTSDVKSVTSHITTMHDDFEAINNKVKKAKVYTAALEEKLKVGIQTALSEEEKAAEINQYLRDEELVIKRLDNELNECRDELFGNKEHFQTLKKEIKDSMAQITGTKSSIHCVDKQLRKLQKDFIVQQRNAVGLDSQINSLQRKLAELQGKTESEELQMQEIKNAELTEVLVEKKKTATMLSNALKESEEDIRYLNKEKEKQDAQKKALTSKVEELMLVCSTNENEVKKLRALKQDNMVDHNIMKIEVKHKRDMLYNKDHSMLSLERRKLELQNVMKERENENKHHREMLYQELKIIEQEKQRLGVEINEKLSKTDMMQKRFEVLTFTMAPPEGEEARAQAYYIMKAAQERMELKTKRDTMDADIRKMELENIALDNSNQLFKHTNSELNKYCKKTNESSPELEEKQRQEEQLREGEQTVKLKKRQLDELEKDLQEMNNISEIQLQEDQLEEHELDQRQSVLNKLKKELASQQEKIDRAAKQSSKLIKELRSERNSSTETFEEKNIKLKELRDLEENIHKMINELNPDIRSEVEKHLVLKHQK